MAFCQVSRAGHCGSRARLSIRANPGARHGRAHVSGDISQGSDAASERAARGVDGVCARAVPKTGGGGESRQHSRGREEGCQHDVQHLGQGHKLSRRRHGREGGRGHGVFPSQEGGGQGRLDGQRSQPVRRAGHSGNSQGHVDARLQGLGEDVPHPHASGHRTAKGHQNDISLWR